MASIIRHFAHPHPLVRSQYSSKAGHHCDICGLKLAGLDGYRCSKCDFDIHDVCAEYFKDSISFFAHPWHTLKLSRMPSSYVVGWTCDLCQDDALPGSLAYRCIECMFDVHPLCTMLPQTIRSSLHPKHDLCMTPGTGTCSACEESLPIWHYRCGLCLIKLDIGCAFANNESTTTSSTSQSIVASRPSRRRRVGKFLLKGAFRLAIDTATGGLGSPVLDVLSAVLD